MGLTVLHPTAEGSNSGDLKVDIVAVHGLNGDAKDTWTDPKTKAFFLEDYLPTDVKGARVLNFSYNADAAFGNTTADILDHAKNLLASLVDQREDDDGKQRPIIFMAYSLGGIIVKQAINWANIESQYHNIRDHTLGIVFFGTPHRGSEKGSYGKVLANVAAGVMHKPKSKLVNALQSNSDTLMRLNSEFRFQAPRYQILSFYELKPMRLFSSLIVEKYSALLDIDGEDQQPIDANHRDMCKVATKDDEMYQKLVKRLNRMMKKKDASLDNT
ncbi:hypothetical protein MMC28_001706, partial [Mycoblastus sanguinarius]|nr:hypothetical protein [Mycoblastus sanguinarius]